jgi:two-component system cell cycle response regulator
VTTPRNAEAKIEALKAEIKRLKRLMVTDELTNLYNRRGLIERLDKLVRRLHFRASPTMGVLSVAMVDIDHFKRINDTYGHRAGDEVLAAFAKLLSHDVRPYDLVGRLGGEEFIIVYVNADQATAKKRCEEIRLLIEGYEFVVSDHAPLRITSSFGVAEMGPETSASDLVKRADVALYKAKTTGRNQVVVARRLSATR